MVFSKSAKKALKTEIPLNCEIAEGSSTIPPSIDSLFLICGNDADWSEFD